MQLNIGKEVTAPQWMTVKEPRAKYAAIFSDEAQTGNKT